MFYVYILHSPSSGRFYIGQTDDLIVRFRQHQAGEARSTKAFRPWIMPYYEMLPTRAHALRREKELKRKKSADSLRRLIAHFYASLESSIPW